MTDGTYMGMGSRDTEGQLRPTLLEGKRFRHSGNNCVYLVTGSAWCGDADTWLVMHQSVGGGETYARTVSNFMGKRHGVARFTQIVD